MMRRRHENGHFILGFPLVITFTALQKVAKVSQGAGNQSMLTCNATIHRSLSEYYCVLRYCVLFSVVPRLVCTALYEVTQTLAMVIISPCC